MESRINDDDKLTIIFNVGKNPVTADFPLLAEATDTNNYETSLYLNKLASPNTTYTNP